MSLLEINRLTLDFKTPRGSVRAVDDVSLSIEAGETLCLVGESGCGKTVTGLSIARLLPTPPAEYGGEIRLEGRDVLRMNAREVRAIRGGKVGYVFQEPGASLNPVMTVGSQIMESLKLHCPEKATQAEVVRLMREVGIAAPEARLKEYAFQLSGGMQQRAMVAMALAAEPQLLVADEPTTALDVTIQAQIIGLLKELATRLRMALLLITHELGVVADIADRVAVMYAGQIVETGPAAAVFERPFHPYTKALLESVPRLSSGRERLVTIPGTVPRGGQFPPGCRFYPRCPSRRPPCETAMPPLVEAVPGRWVRSFYRADQL